MHTWKTRIAATLAVLMLTNCISPAAFAQNTEESPQSTQVSLLSDENNAGFTIEDGVLTAYTGSATNVAIPEGVTVIGDGSSPVFGSKVESVTIPASVTAITDKAFYNCTELTSVTFAEGSRLKTIGNEAFYAVNQLESLTIPEGVTSIGQYAFTAMNKLQTITLPGTLTKVCSGEWFGSLFGRGTSGGAPVALNSVNITEDGEQYRSHDGAVYSADGKTLIYCPAAKQSIDWLAGVEEIASYRLTHIEIPEGVVSIGDSALRISRGLTSVSLPSTLERLGTAAPLVFAPANESGQFSGTDDLISITVAEGNRNYSSRDGLLYTADGKTLLYCPAGRTGTVTVADGTQVIDTYAFHRSQASHVALPDGLQSIRDYGFKQSALISVELPDSVESIGNNAFFNCSALKTAQLGNGLKTIGENAFSLTRIAQVTIPAGVSSIGKNAFDFEYGGQNLFVRILGAETTLADEFIPYNYAITVYGAAGSAAEKYVATKRADKGDRCKLTFKNLDSYEAVTQVTLDKTELTLKQRETAVLGASVQPETATHTDLVFKSFDTKIAAVSADGTVTAVAPGVATIRVISTDGPYADCRVTVTRDETISDFTVDDRGYITGYTGESGNLVIPGTVENETVLGVASGAFQNRWDTAVRWRV